MGSLVFGVLMGAIVILLFWYFIGKEFERIAQLKGHFEKRYFWCSFLLGPIGMLMVIALPDRGNVVEPTKAQAVDELPDL